MGKLQDYPSKSIPAAGDKFVMSNAADGNNTYSVDYIDLVNSIPGTKVPLTASIAQDSDATKYRFLCSVFNSPIHSGLNPKGSLIA